MTTIGGSGNGGNGTDGRSGRAVPDAVLPGAAPEGPNPYEEMFGEEAAVPPGDYGPPIPSEFPDPSRITQEIREIERRVRAHLSPVFPLVPRRRPPLEWMWKRYRRFAMRNRAGVVDDYGRDPVYAARVEPLLDFLCRHYFRVEAIGVERVPSGGGALIIANHAGPTMWDAALLMHSVRRQHPQEREIRPLVDDDLFHFPYLGVFINRIGGVRACAENAARLLGDAELVAAFPEGMRAAGRIRREQYQLDRFGRGGFVKLALRAAVPVVPVGMVCLEGLRSSRPIGLGEEVLSRVLGALTWPVGGASAIPLPGLWRVRVGEPIDFSGQHRAEAADDPKLCAELAEVVRSRVQAEVDCALKS
jgi:1-acyl-sn-glycerol-3-phosphate acyltransferase